ncbi:MAG: beta-ketoacyl synthase N-terminal-like domain-containing protein [Abditibacteriaceae bacterium]
MELSESIVVTGYNAITARGDFPSRGKSTFADALADSARSLSGAEANSIADFDIKNHPVSKKTYLDRCSALALAAAALALQDAGISHPPENAARFGITLGTHYGCIDTMKTFWDNLAEKGARHANALLFSHSYFNSPISLCAIEFGLQGYHNTVCAGSNSGLEAVRLAHDAIAAGHADAMVCGGVDALTEARTIMNATENASEAAVFFVLEKSSFAEERGAKVLLEIDETFWGEISESTFGDCGAATSALALLSQITNVKI